MEEKRRPGRPAQYDEPKVNETHRMTARGHEYIKTHREKIERDAEKWSKSDH